MLRQMLTETFRNVSSYPNEYHFADTIEHVNSGMKQDSHKIVYCNEDHSIKPTSTYSNSDVATKVSSVLESS